MQLRAADGDLAGEPIIWFPAVTGSSPFWLESGGCRSAGRSDFGSQPADGHQKQQKPTDPAHVPAPKPFQQGSPAQAALGPVRSSAPRGFAIRRPVSRWRQTALAQPRASTAVALASGVRGRAEDVVFGQRSVGTCVAFPPRDGQPAALDLRYALGGADSVCSGTCCVVDFDMLTPQRALYGYCCQSRFLTIR